MITVKVVAYASRPRQVDGQTRQRVDGRRSELPVVVVRHPNDVLLRLLSVKLNTMSVIVTYLHRILKYHAGQSVYLLFRGRFEALRDLFDHSFQGKDEQGESCLEDLYDLVYEFPRLACGGGYGELGRCRPGRSGGSLAVDIAVITAAIDLYTTCICTLSVSRIQNRVYSSRTVSRLRCVCSSCGNGDCLCGLARLPLQQVHIFFRSTEREEEGLLLRLASHRQDE